MQTLRCLPTHHKRVYADRQVTPPHSGVCGLVCWRARAERPIKLTHTKCRVVFIWPSHRANGQSPGAGLTGLAPLHELCDVARGVSPFPRSLKWKHRFVCAKGRRALLVVSCFLALLAFPQARDDIYDNNEVFERPFSIEPKARTTNVQTKRRKVPDTQNSHAAHINVSLISPSTFTHTHVHMHAHTHTHTHTRAHTHISQITQSMFERA